MFKFIKDEEVIYDIGILKGEGKIVGCVTTGFPILGKQYLIQSTDGQFPNDVYPYNTIGVYEVYIEHA